MKWGKIGWTDRQISKYYKIWITEPWPVWLSWLELCPINWKVAGLIPGQGTCLVSRFGPRSESTPEAINRCLSSSLKSNKHVLTEEYIYIYIQIYELQNLGCGYLASQCTNNSCIFSVIENFHYKIIKKGNSGNEAVRGSRISEVCQRTDTEEGICMSLRVCRLDCPSSSYLQFYLFYFIFLATSNFRLHID